MTGARARNTDPAGPARGLPVLSPVYVRVLVQVKVSQAEPSGARRSRQSKSVRKEEKEEVMVTRGGMWSSSSCRSNPPDLLLLQHESFLYTENSSLNQFIMEVEPVHQTILFVKIIPFIHSKNIIYKAHITFNIPNWILYLSIEIKIYVFNLECN